jgi:hypothetical protein
MQHEWDRTYMCTRFWWEDVKERDHLENRRVDGSTILNWILKQQDRRIQTGFIRLAVVGRIWEVLTFVTQYTSCRSMYVQKST